MSIIPLAEAKKYLDVIHDADDDKLQMILDAAEDEALQFLDRRNLTDWRSCAEIHCDDVVNESSSESQMPASVRLAILILVQGGYQTGPGQMRHEAEQLRDIAEKKLFPFRCGLGV